MLEPNPGFNTIRRIVTGTIRLQAKIESEIHIHTNKTFSRSTDSSVNPAISFGVPVVRTTPIPA